MSSVSLKKNAAPEAGAEKSKNEIVPTQTTEVSTHVSSNSDVQGEVGRSDINIPGFQIVQAVGPASENHEAGTILLNREAELSDGEKPVKLTVLKLKVSYIENVEYGSEVIPRRFDTLAEVKEAGGHIEWIDDQRPPFSKMAEALIAVEAPEGVDESVLAHFPFEFGGKSYALALWSIRGSAFTRAGKTIITAAEFALKAGLHTGAWTLTSKREKLGKNFVFVPVLRHAEKNSQELQEFFISLKQ